MKILHRQILKETFSHGLLGLLLFTFVLFLRDTSRLLELLLRESAYLRNVAALFLLSFPAVLTFTIPLAILIGILITLSRMASEGEVIALRAAGVGVRVFLLPLSVFAVLGCALALYFSVSLAPDANRRRVVHWLALQPLQRPFQRPAQGPAVWDASPSAQTPAVSEKEAESLAKFQCV